MNAAFRSGLLSGLVAGAALAGLAALLLRGRPVPEPPPPPAAPAAAPAPPDADARVAALEAENARLRLRVAALEKPAAPSPGGEESPEPPPPGLEEAFAALAKAGLAGMQGDGFRKALDAAKAGGSGAVEFLGGRLLRGKTAAERFLAGALLENVGDAAAVPALAEALAKDADALVRRMASHALAVLGGAGAEAPLTAAAAGDADWGVRVNSAYGLAKLGREAGLRQLQDAYTSAQTPPEYRLPILGGLADVADPSTAPLFRSILAETEDVSYVLMSIKALSAMKDVEALPALDRLAASGPSDTVKEAAAAAAAEIRR